MYMIPHKIFKLKKNISLFTLLAIRPLHIHFTFQLIYIYFVNILKIKNFNFFLKILYKIL
jgi:hypothetical protein